MEDNEENNSPPSFEFLEPPTEFYKIMKDLLSDLLITFPEYKEKITQEEIEILEGDVSGNKLFLHKIFLQKYIESRNQKADTRT